MKKFTAVTILQNTAKRLQKKGWCQYTSGPASGPNCLSAAIYHEGKGRIAEDQARNTIHACLPKNSSIVGWNDTTGRTKKEVLAVIAKAIKKLSKKTERKGGG